MSASPRSISWLKTWAQAPPSPGDMLQPQGPPGIASGKQSLWASEVNSRPQAKLPWPWHFICKKRLDATPSLPRCSEGVTGPFPFSTVRTPCLGLSAPSTPRQPSSGLSPWGPAWEFAGDLGWEEVR